MLFLGCLPACDNAFYLTKTSCLSLQNTATYTHCSLGVPISLVHANTGMSTSAARMHDLLGLGRCGGALGPGDWPRVWERRHRPGTSTRAPIRRRSLAANMRVSPAPIGSGSNLLSDIAKQLRFPIYPYSLVKHRAGSLHIGWSSALSLEHGLVILQRHGSNIPSITVTAAKPHDHPHPLLFINPPRHGISLPRHTSSPEPT
jgi:hypothetical protein